MIASLDVFQLHSSDVGVRITCVDSLFEALKVIRKKGSGEYIVYSRKTGRRRFYKVDGGGKIVLWENEELAFPGG